jgi:hypothetical protein
MGNLLDRTEAMAKRVALAKGYQIWRGRYVGFIFPQDMFFSCVLVGLPDENDPPPVSAVVLAVGFELRSDCCRINGDNYSGFIPDDPWDAIQEQLNAYP